MEQTRIVLNSDKDVEEALLCFEVEAHEEIRSIVKEYPCILIGSYAHDIDFGEIHLLSVVQKEDFDREPGKEF